MKKIKISRNLLYKALIFVITVSVIVYFMPRDSKFNYQFDIGKPWKYGQLMATFDFPIYKGAEVIKKEQDSLMHHFQPFFNIDKEQGRKALEMLKEDCQGELSLVLPADYIRYVERQLKEIYETGILTTEALDSLQKDSTESIMIVDEKLVNQQRTDGLYSVKTAYKKLLTADTLRYRPGVLQAAGLNNYLMPNLTYDKERSEAARQELLDSYSWASGIVLSGQKIIDRGEIVSEKTYNILISYRQEFIKRSETNGQRRLVLTGQILFVGIFMLCFMLYLDLFRKGYYEHRGGMALLFAGITIYCAITGLMMSQHFMTVYMLPYAMLPIIIRVFLDSRTAFLSLVVTMLIMISLVTELIIRPQPWYAPQLVVPLTGMLLGNTVSALAVGLSRFFESMKERRDEVDTLLALGATTWEAARPSIVSSIRLGLLPTTASLASAGIVTVPGMMAGQIIAGGNPIDAAKYQFMILATIAALTLLADSIIMLMVYKRCFTALDQYQPVNG